MDDNKLVPEEFVVEENLNYDKEVSVNEGVSEDNKTMKTSNLPPPPAVENPSKAIRCGPLTFDPSPPQEEGEDTQLAAANNHTKMRWHYCLRHLPFVKLKQLALNGEISKKLVKVKPPKCTGCLFGMMTKIPWGGRETRASHKVFIATKPGECASVDQMMSTEVGFYYTQMKGKLTKKRYRCATVFINHYSRLHFVHLQVDDSSGKTVAAKHAFETFATKHGVKIQHYHCNNG
jgi:hypothetical protein